MSNLRLAPLTVAANAFGVVEDNVAGISTRWYDAWGDVSKAVFDNMNGTNGITSTLTGSTPTFVPSVNDGELYTITTPATEYAGQNAQVTGESLILEAGKPLKVYGKIKLSDATKSDFLFGLAEIKTDLMNTSSSHAITSSAVEGIFFAKVTDATTIYAYSYLDGVATGTAAVGTMDTSAHEYEIDWDGSKVSFYFDEVLVATFSTSLPDGALTLSWNFRAGAAAAKVFTIYNGLRVIQARS